MAGIFLEVVKTVAEWSWNPVKRGLSYTFHYKRKVESLKVPVEQLEKLHKDYQSLVDAAVLSGKVIRPDLNKWLKDTEKGITDVRAMQNKAQGGKQCCHGWCPDLKWRYSLGKKAVEEATKINKLQADGKFESISIPDAAPRPIEIESPGEFEAFGSRSHVMDQIMEALRDDTVSIIGVHGMGGIGKTTLVKHAGAQARKEGLFVNVALAVVSQTPDFKKIQGELAAGLGIKLMEESEILGRAGELKERIMRGKRTLVILDDIWDEIDLSKIGVPGQSELQRCNCKILLTTRLRSACSRMNSQTKIALNILSEEDSWALFARTAGRTFDSIDFLNEAKKVCGECKGLPIALVVVAKSLGDKEIEDWKVAAQRLQMCQTADPEEDDKRVFESIKLSYDFLKTDVAKSLFLLCCLFPEDSDIKIEALMRYGFGNGLFKDENTIEEARVRAHSVAKHLVSCSLLLHSKADGCVSMHDVIRDSAMWIAKSVDGRGFLVRADCGLEKWPNYPNRHGEGYSAISLMHNMIDKLPKELVCTHLQILSLQLNRPIKEIPETFFQIPNAIRVLDLSLTSISQLPHSFSLLSDLHALYLDGCWEITNLSLLGGLAELEFLSMRYYKGDRLPKEIGDLVELRMLDLTASSVKEIPSKVISRLQKLEELYLPSHLDWARKDAPSEEEETNVGIDEVLGLSDLNIFEGNFPDAECLPTSVEFIPNWVKFDIRIAARYPPVYFNAREDRSTSLTLGASMNTLPDWFVNAVTEKAKGLLYRKCEGLHNILVEHDRGRLQGLKYLAVDNCKENLEVLMNAIEWVPKKPVFERLEVLRLYGLSLLKEFCVGELPPGSLCNLKSLIVLDCDQLSNTLLPKNLLQRLQKLKRLACYGLENMKYVFESEGLEPKHTVLTELEVMVLGQVRNLTKIWNGPAPNAIFHNIKYFLIDGSNQLKYLFTIDVARCFSRLECLLIINCVELVRVVEPSETTDDKFVFPQLKDLVLEDLSKMTRVDIECPMLENLYLRRCGFDYCSPVASDFHSTKQVRLRDDGSELFENFLSLLGNLI